MCGIAGILLPYPNYQYQTLKTNIQAMVNTLTHRGPDDQDVWIDHHVGIALGHRRLAIIELSPLGKQPMLSKDGRYLTVFNGEIYNFLELKKELSDFGHRFNGNSDTEVLLAAISQWGINKAVERFIGMFAFALWDRNKRTLHLARDRLGIKPLYYGWMPDGIFLFASELKAMRAWPNFNNSINLNSLALFFRHNYIPSPHTIYRDIYKAIPGQIITIKQYDLPRKKLHFYSYWSAEQVWQKGLTSPFPGTEGEATDLLEKTLIDSVRYRMVSDVPLGAFLSGGVDSSTVVALMQSLSNQPVRTFSIGFWEADYNEAPMAKAIAKHIGTNHTELYVKPDDALNVIPQIPTIWDEPFADSSQIPTYIISKLTREHVTVSLSGDGGDELFWGYPRYEKTWKIWRICNRIPKVFRQILFYLLKALPNKFIDFLGKLVQPILSKYGIYGQLSRFSNRICELLSADNFRTFYGWANSHFLPHGEILPRRDGIASIFSDSEAENKNLWALMSLLDVQSYLPDDILTKVDRASMAVSLEARVPLLDHRIVEFAASLPANMKIRNGQGKWILRQVLYRYVPEKLLNRPKMGFGVPIGQWLRGPLREWAESLLAVDRIRKEGYLNPGVVSSIWQDHLSGRCNHQYILWNILMFQAWLETWA